MSINEQWFLNNLTDFSDLKHKSNIQDWASVQSKHSNRKSNSNFDLEKDTGDKLLKNFKDLKDKLKDMEKQNKDLQHVIERKDDEINRLKALQKQNIKKFFEISKEMKQLKSINEEYKQKLIYAKESIKDKKVMEQELELIKLRFSQQKQMLKKYEEQRKAVLEIGIMEKLQFEQRIKRAQSRNASDLSYIQQMENEVSKAKERAIKLQAQLKKMQIKYDEEIYNKKWKNGNYQKQQLQIQTKQLNQQLRAMAQKDNKQKQKRTILEKRVLELEELSGLWVVKAQTYDNENKTLCRKIKKMERKLQDNEYKMDQALADSVYWEDRFLKSFAVGQELINRVKRQLLGDVVSLAKSCQYKLQKLKQDERNCKNSFNKKSPLNKRSQSKTRSRSIATLATPTRKLFDNLIGETQKKALPLQENRDNIITETKQNIQNPYQKQDLISKANQYLFKPMNFENTFQVNSGTFEHTFKKSQNQQNKYSAIGNISQNSICNKYTGQQHNLQLKIKKQRQQMQKKIREKLLYQRIQMASSSPQKNQLRSEYMRLMDI